MSQQELKPSPAAQKAAKEIAPKFNRLDRDGDSRISKEELAKLKMPSSKGESIGKEVYSELQNATADGAHISKPDLIAVLSNTPETRVEALERSMSLLAEAQLKASEKIIDGFISQGNTPESKVLENPGLYSRAKAVVKEVFAEKMNLKPGDPAVERQVDHNAGWQNEAAEMRAVYFAELESTFEKIEPKTVVAMIDSAVKEGDRHAVSSIQFGVQRFGNGREDLAALEPKIDAALATVNPDAAEPSVLAQSTHHLNNLNRTRAENGEAVLRAASAVGVKISDITLVSSLSLSSQKEERKQELLTSGVKPEAVEQTLMFDRTMRLTNLHLAASYEPEVTAVIKTSDFKQLSAIHEQLLQTDPSRGDSEIALAILNTGMPRSVATGLIKQGQEAGFPADSVSARAGDRLLAIIDGSAKSK